MNGCYFCGCDFATLRVLPGKVLVCACDSCRDDIIADAFEPREQAAPVVEVQREVSAAIDALAAW